MDSSQSLFPRELFEEAVAAAAATRPTVQPPSHLTPSPQPQASVDDPDHDSKLLLKLQQNQSNSTQSSTSSAAPPLSASSSLSSSLLRLIETIVQLACRLTLVAQLPNSPKPPPLSSDPAPAPALHWLCDVLRRLHEHLSLHRPTVAIIDPSATHPPPPKPMPSPSPALLATISMRVEPTISHSAPSDDLDGVEDAKVISEDDTDVPVATDRPPPNSKRPRKPPRPQSKSQNIQYPGGPSALSAAAALSSQPALPRNPSLHALPQTGVSNSNINNSNQSNKSLLHTSSSLFPSRSNSHAIHPLGGIPPALPLEDGFISAQSSQFGINYSRSRLDLPLGSPSNSYLTGSWKSLGQGEANKLHRDYSKIFKETEDGSVAVNPGESSIEIAGGNLYRHGALSNRWNLAHKIGEGGYAIVRFATGNPIVTTMLDEKFDNNNYISRKHSKYRNSNFTDANGAIMSDDSGGGANSVEQMPPDKIVSAVKVISKKSLDLYNERMVSREVFSFRLIGMAGGHSNIVELYEVCEDEDNVYLVMELLQGGELFSRIAEKGQYTERDAANLVVSMLSSMAFCHQLNLTHRDVKPENFVFASQDSDGTDVKLTDFGIAHYSEDPSALCKTLCGTPLYVAPEVLLRQPYGPQADLWSLGVIVYIMLVGYPPFDDNDLVQLVKKIKYRPVKFEGIEWQLISDEGKHFLTNLLDKDASSRMTAQQALEHDWLKNQCIAATENVLQDAQTNIKSFVSRNRWKSAIQSVKAMNRLNKMVTLSREGQNHGLDDLDAISAEKVEVVHIQRAGDGTESTISERDARIQQQQHQQQQHLQEERHQQQQQRQQLQHQHHEAGQLQHREDERMDMDMVDMNMEMNDSDEDEHHQHNDDDDYDSKDDQLIPLPTQQHPDPSRHHYPHPQPSFPVYHGAQDPHMQQQQQLYEQETIRRVESYSTSSSDDSDFPERLQRRTPLHTAQPIPLSLNGISAERDRRSDMGSSHLGANSTLPTPPSSSHGSRVFSEKGSMENSKQALLGMDDGIGATFGNAPMHHHHPTQHQHVPHHHHQHLHQHAHHPQLFHAPSSGTIRSTGSGASVGTNGSGRYRASGGRHIRRLSLTRQRRRSRDSPHALKQNLSQQHLYADEAGAGSETAGGSGSYMRSASPTTTTPAPLVLAMDPAFESSDDSRNLERTMRHQLRRRRAGSLVPSPRTDTVPILASSETISTAKLSGPKAYSAADEDSSGGGGRLGRSLTRGDGGGVVRKMSSHARKLVGAPLQQSGSNPHARRMGVVSEDRDHKRPNVALSVGDHRKHKRFPWFR